jgi:drug/metabolite transporter (DMT)-like permease
LGLLALYSGLAAGPMGLVAPIAAMEVVVPVVFGVFARGERPDPLQFLGVALAVAGILLVTRGHDGQEAPVTSRAILLGVLAALLLGTMVVFMDAGGRISAAWTVLFLRVGAMGVLVPAALIVRPSFRLESRDKSTLVAVGLLDNGSNLLFTLAAATGALLSLIGVLASLYPVTTVFLARLVLSERLTRIQITGVVAAFAGVALIAAG